MTREQAIMTLIVVDENATCDDCLYYNQMEDCPNDEDCIIRQALDMAIKALEQKPCGDAISKQAVDTLVDELARAISDERCCISRGRSTATIMQDILDLPPVNPQEPSITWVTGADGAKIAFKDVPVWKVTKICEILGEPQESEDKE